MTDGLDRLRGADPAGSLPPQPDARAEDDLRLLLTEPVPVPTSTAVPALPRPRGPLLVTALVAAAVMLTTVVVLAVVRPSALVAAAPTRPAPTTTVEVRPPYLLDCRPVEVAPFQCGTYRSVYGASSVTGDTGGPAADPLSISFAHQQGVLLLKAVSRTCFAAVVPVRYDGHRLVRAGDAVYGQAAGCTGSRDGSDRAHWAYAFLNGPLELDPPSGGLVFGLRSSLVTFEYQGPSAAGEPQPPRNDRTCVPAHVDPFRCGTYRSTSGAGALAFLGEDRYRLTFQHVNGELTAVLAGRCNALSASLQLDARSLVVQPRGSTAMGCVGDRQAHDHTVSGFFDGVLSVEIGREAVTFTNAAGTASATFHRD